jgi:hypothetical protein
VIIADIAATLKCNAKCPDVEEQWIACPSMLTSEEIVEDMCDVGFLFKVALIFTLLLPGAFYLALLIFQVRLRIEWDSRIKGID